MCVFCKIINKEFSSNIIYEDEDVMAFLDLVQANNGHTIVVPKKHYSNIFSIDNDILNKVITVVKKIAPAICKATNCDSINVINNSGENAGQTIFHFHFHLIPRYKNDGINLEVRDRSGDLKEEDYVEIKKNIIENL